MTTPNDLRVPRQSLATRLAALNVAEARKYADFVRKGDQETRLPCWGAIAQRFVEVFPRDEQRLAVLDALLEEGDRRPLYLFLETSRSRPKLLAALCARAAELPVSVQRNLVAMHEAATFVAASLDNLHPAARHVWDGGEALKRNERDLLAARVGELLAFQYFVPDTFDPHDEPKVVS